MSRRAPWWFPPISFVGIAVVVCFFSFFYHFVPLAVTGQLCLLVIIVRAFCYWRPMQQWIAGMPVAHRLVFGGLIGAMVLGHYSLNGRTFFPFVVWEIFPHAEKGGPVMARELIGKTASGAKVRLLVEQQFPSIVQVDRLEDMSPQTTDALAASIQQLRDMVGRHLRSPVPCHSLRVTFASGGLLSPGLAQQVQARLCSHIVVQPPDE